MDPQELKERLQGAIGFPVTPFKADLSLDLSGLRSNLESMLQHPFCAFVAAGGTGEMYSLTPDEYRQVVRTAVEVANGAMPVIAGTGFGTSIGCDLAKSAAELGTDGILAFPPYYPQADDEGMMEYYKTIGQATDLGLVIYSRDWANFSPATAERFTEIPTLVAWKEGQANIRRLQMMQKRIGDRLRWIGGAGDDMVPAYYASGIRTYTSSISNVAPQLSILLHQYAAEGENEKLTTLINDYVVPLYELRARRKGYEVSAMKVMMDQLSLAGGPCRPPIPMPREDEVDELKTMVEQWKPVL